MHFFRTCLDQSGGSSKSAQKRVQMKAGFSKYSHFWIRQANSYFQSFLQKRYWWSKIYESAKTKKWTLFRNKKWTFFRNDRVPDIIQRKKWTFFRNTKYFRHLLVFLLASSQLKCWPWNISIVFCLQKGEKGFPEERLDARQINLYA